MAGDWLPIRHDLPEDPAVIAIASLTGLEEDAVVGKLIRVWRWFDAQTTDGNAPSVTQMWLDRHIGVTGFSAAMVQAGWLTDTGTGLQIPKFEAFISQSAKQRVLTAKRVAKTRTKVKRECNAASVTSALPKEQNRREEEEYPPTPQPSQKPRKQPRKQTKAKEGEATEPVGMKTWEQPERPGPKFVPAAVPLPERLAGSEAFVEVWNEWLAYLRRKTNGRVDQETVTRQLREFDAAGPLASIAAINRAITNGWLSPAMDRPAAPRGGGPLQLPELTDADIRGPQR